jgi:hypothetical protein
MPAGAGSDEADDLDEFGLSVSWRHERSIRRHRQYREPSDAGSLHKQPTHGTGKLRGRQPQWIQDPPLDAQRFNRLPETRVLRGARLVIRAGSQPGRAVSPKGGDVSGDLTSYPGWVFTGWVGGAPGSS